MDKMKMESVNLTEKNIEKIAALFPNCITESTDEKGNLKKAINFDMLRSMLSEDIADGNEAYEFTWVGKKAAIAEANRPIRKTLRPCPKESVNWDTTENLYIEGDNIDVLKLLQESYLGKIKLIYIDPPYNTGKDFIYNDNYSKSLEDYEEDLGIENVDGHRLFKNKDTNGRFHSSWCTSIYPAIKLASNLLKKDGIILISIDEHEVNNLKKIADEIFGEQNFVVQVAVNRPSEIATGNIISKHEYLLVYSKDISEFNVDGISKYTISRGTVGNADQTMPKITFPKGIPCYNINDGTYNETRKIEGSSENIYNESPIIVKNGLLAEEVNLTARWRSSNDMRNFFNNHCQPTQAKINGIIEEIYFENDRFNPQIKKKTFEKIPSLILDNKRGSLDLEKIGMENCFSFPKSVSYIKKIINYIDLNNEIVLDFFSGSSTTAHAVIESMVNYDKKINFIMVQINENLDETLKRTENTEQNAIKSAINFLDTQNLPHLFTELGKERIRRAGNKIKNENPLSAANLDIGFRVFKLDETNMEDVYYSPAEISQEGLQGTLSNIKAGRTDLDLLFSCIIEWGLPLSMPYKSEKIGKSRIHTYNDGDLIACFDKNITEDAVKEIAKRKPLRVVFRDDSFADSPSKINVTEIFKMISPDTKIKVI